MSYCTQCGYRLTGDEAGQPIAESIDELVEGVALSDLIEQQAPVFWRRALELLDGLCAAVTEARAADAELDLVPERIFVEHVPGRPRRIKLLDATIDRLRGHEPRDTVAHPIAEVESKRGKYGGMVMSFSFAYFSPEKLMGKPLTTASDVYVLGIVAFELLTGRKPFDEARGPAGLITAQLKQSPPLPSELIPEVPPDVDHVILKCLQKDRALRFEDAAAMRRPIAEILKRTASQLDPERANHDELERAIAEEPLLLDGYEVYGDWLQEQGDPRGQLVALQVAVERLSMQGDHATAKQRQAEAAAYLDAHTAFLLGPLRKHAARSRRGFDPFRWRCGFIHGVALETDVAAVLEAVQGHPSGRFVTDFDLAIDASSAPAVLGLLTRASPITLRALTLRSSAPLGDLSELLQRVPHVQALTVIAPLFELGDVELPNVAALGLHAGRLSVANARSITRMRCPLLRALSIRVGDSSAVRLSHLSPLLARTDLPALDTLAITAWADAGALCRQLSTGALSRQLLGLDVSFATIGAEHLASLAAQRLPNLRRVTVSSTRLLDGSLLPFELRDGGATDQLADLERSLAIG